MRTIFVSIVVFAAAALLWVNQCSGPRPAVVGSARVEAPEQPGDPYRVAATVRNDGLGHGEARVTVRLVNTATGEAYQRDEQVQLARDEIAVVVVEILAPPGDYTARAEAEFPPE